jgi:hypothetical protein
VPKERRDSDHRAQGRAHHEHPDRDDELFPAAPTRAGRLYLAFILTDSRATDPMTASVSYSMFTFMLDHLLLPPPHLRPLTYTPGLACQIYLAGRGRGVQREAVDPPSSKAQA